MADENNQQKLNGKELNTTVHCQNAANVGHLHRSSSCLCEIIS